MPEPMPVRKFAGWRILLLATITASLSAPGQTIGVSVFVPSLIADLHLSDNAVSLSYLIGTLLGALGMPWIGRRIDAWGIRRALTAIGIGFGVGLVVMSGVRGFVSLSIGYGLIRFLGQGSLSLVSTVAVTHWFDRRRGLVFGIMTTVTAALMALAPVGLNAIIQAYSWRIAWVAAAFTIWIVVLPIARFGMINLPSDVGQVPDGDISSREQGSATQVSLTQPQAVRTGRFWIIVAATATTGMLATALNFHQISLLGEAGLTPSMAALMFTPQVIGSSLAALAFGFMEPRVKGRWLITGSMLLLSAALLVGSSLTSTASIVVYAVLLGSAGGGARTVGAALPPRWFGTRHIGAIQGFATLFNVGSTSLGPLGLALARDVTGDRYGPALLWFATIPVTVAVAAIIVGWSAERRLARASG